MSFVPIIQIRKQIIIKSILLQVISQIKSISLNDIYKYDQRKET